MSRKNVANKKSNNNKMLKASDILRLEKQVLNEARSRKPRKPKMARGGAGRQVSVAANYASGQSGKAPKVRATKDSCNVVHRELLANVSGGASSAFTLFQQFALNPGLAATFPWLSAMAQNWETYRFRKLRFCYYTRTGSTTVGSVVFVPDYDAADAQPANEQIASTFEDVQEDAPWKDIMTPLRPVEMHQPGVRKYIRTGALASNLDIKTYDSGNLFVFTVDSAAAAPWGKLWVEYDVDLYTPQSLSSAPVGVAGFSADGGGTQSGANPMGTAPNNLSSAFITIDNASTVTFQKTGNYLVAGKLSGTVMSDIVFGGTATVNPAASVFDTGADAGVYYAGVIVSTPGQTFNFSLTATTVTQATLNIGSLPFGVV